MKYKVLTLWEPWATLLVHGIKKIETRPKPTTWTIEKGSYLIHSAKKWTREQRELIHDDIFRISLSQCDKKIWLHGFNFGHIIGAVDVVECIQITYITEKLENFIISLDTIVSRKEYGMGNYNIGRYMWMTENHRILETPIPYKGGQGYYQDFKGDVNQLKFKD